MSSIPDLIGKRFLLLCSRDLSKPCFGNIAIWKKVSSDEYKCIWSALNNGFVMGNYQLVREIFTYLHWSKEHIKGEYDTLDELIADNLDIFL